jgi:DNA-binding NarL/FixJ family response regulator
MMPAQASGLAQALHPDVVLIDAETPDLDTVEVVRALAEADTCRGIVVLSQHGTTMADRLTAHRATVVGKHEGLASLVRAIRSAAGGCRDEP